MRLRLVVKHAYLDCPSISLAVYRTLNTALQYTSSQRDVAEQLSEFDKRSGQRIEAALTAACGDWLREARQVGVEAAQRVDNLIPRGRVRAAVMQSTSKRSSSIGASGKRCKACERSSETLDQGASMFPCLCFTERWQP